MRRRSAIPLLWLAAAVLGPISSAAAQTPPAVAPTPVRAERRVLLSVGLVYPMTLDHDVTGPLPSLRLGVNISPRLVLELTGSSIPYEVSGRVTLIDAGLRWHLTDGSLSPYVMAHAGEWFDDLDEGGERSYPYAALGGGVEYACRCGFAAWVEAAPALISYTAGGPHSTVGGVYMGLGLGYRIRTAQTERRMRSSRSSRSRSARRSRSSRARGAPRERGR